MNLTTDTISASPALPHFTGPSFLFLGLNLRPEKLGVWSTTWSSCPLQRFMPAAVQMVLLFFLQNLISLPMPLLSSNGWHISTNRACLCCQCLQRSRKLSQTLQSQRCYPKKATTNTWQENEMMFAKDNKERAHICPLDIMHRTVGWHHWLDGRELEQSLGVGNGQGILVCYSP